ILCPDTVPTNTEDDWYNELKKIANNHCSMRFQQSKQEDWVKLIFKFECQIINNRHVFSSYYIKALNIKVNNLLNIYELFRNHTICVTEKVSSLHFKNPEDCKVEKEIRFTFSKKTIS